MATITIALDDDQARRLDERARDAGISPEQLVQAEIADWLNRQDREFVNAAAYVVEKNAELYRRLAK